MIAGADTAEPGTAAVTIGMLGYGARLPQADAILRLAALPQVASIRILWNQPGADVRERLLALAAACPAVRVAISDVNLGSAGGYARLLDEFAAAPDGGFLWLLDDDLEPAPDCLERLVAAARRPGTDAARTVFLAYRPGLTELRDLVERRIGILASRPGTCIGVHVANAFGRAREPVEFDAAAREFALASAPYGGLFVPRAALDALGRPRAELFLYADDSELTMRFTRGGGRIRLVVDAVLHDREPAWNEVARGSTNLVRRISHLPETKVYHEVRNRTFLVRTLYPGHPLVYAANRLVFLGAAWLLALAAGRPHRAQLIARAVADGERMARSERAR